MRHWIVYFLTFVFLHGTEGHALQVGYSFAITTTYASGDPFPARIDQNFIEPDTGFFQVENTGETTFTGLIGTIAISSFAGDLSWSSPTLALAPGESASVAIPDDSSAVGGFNGPYYFYRPGVEITLNGTVSDATGSETVDLLIADRDIHSGIPRTDPFGLTSDSFVLQGGDPWGFNNGDAYAVAQADGVATLSQAVNEPAPAVLLTLPVACLASTRLLRGRRRAAIECVPA